MTKWMRVAACAAAVWCGLEVSATAAVPLASAELPRITAVQSVGGDLVVTVYAPVGARRITLSTKDGIGLGGWTPRAVRHVDGQGGEVVFTIPRLDPRRMLRVTADDDGGLPAEFFVGATGFEKVPRDLASNYGYDSRWVGLDIHDEDGVLLPPTANPREERREVVESDIWKIRGDRLYFFNQFRGLHVLDIADIDRPELLGTLAMPGVGEQMYVLGGRHVVLLVGSPCGVSGESDAACVVVDVGGGAPTSVAEVPVPGGILESRLVGTALYVASGGYMPSEDGSTWVWKAMVTSFDLTDPAHPVQQRQLSLSGFDPVLVATDEWLFAALRTPEDYRSTVIYAVNIASPVGTMWKAAQLRVPGQVPDSFKMQLRGTVFSVIYESLSGDLSTRLETYRFVGLLGFHRLGEVELAHGERLFATRFDGDRAYIVTFEQIDPLWVVDLSDPRLPTILGELEVPGFSTYIHPMGDRLVTIGREDSHVAVSLFGVDDPAHPILLDRELVGDEAWWSSSEATIDEKAFGVLEAEGLILLPFHYSADRGMVSAVQLVDLSEQGLAERGRIEHALKARRATVVDGRVISISGSELAVVDIDDRDRPVVTASLPLSWAVNRIFSHGGYLVALATGASGIGEGSGAKARIAAVSDPGEVLGEVSLGSLPLVGASLRDGRLFLAQADAAGYPHDFFLAPAAEGDGSEVEGPVTFPLTVTVYDLSRLPEFEAEGSTTANLERPLWGRLEDLWPRDGVLVWKAEDSYWPVMWRGAAMDSVLRVAPWYSSSEYRLLAFDVGTPARPGFRSDFGLPENGWGFPRGKSFAAGGLVYTSRGVLLDAHGRRLDDGNLNRRADSVWRGDVLEAVDYEDPAKPALRPPIPLSGTLVGISRGGNLLYAVAYREAGEGSGDWRPELDVLAYDGLSAYRVASRVLPDAWSGWVRVTGESAVLGHGAGANTGPGLQAMTLDAHGEFLVSGRTEVPAPVYEWESAGDLAAARAGNRVLVYEASALPAFRLAADASFGGCISYDLTRAYGEADVALWVPLGDYGMWTIPVVP